MDSRFGMRNLWQLWLNEVCLNFHGSIAWEYAGIDAGTKQNLQPEFRVWSYDLDTLRLMFTQRYWYERK